MSVWLRLGRVSNLPTVWTNCLAGAVLAGAVLDERLLSVCGAMSLFYVGGMYLNDAFDREIDAQERPERPIPSGQVSARAVFIAGFVMLMLGVRALIAIAHYLYEVPAMPVAIAGFGTAGLIVAYDAYHKGNPLSPLLMGLCRVGVYVCAALAVRGEWGQAPLLGAGALLCYLIGLTYVAKQENLSRVSNLWPLAFLAAPFLVTAAAWQQPLAAVLWAVLLGWVAFAIRLLVRKPPQIPRAVVSFIAGISLVDGLLVAAQGAQGWALWGLAGFAMTLGLQRFVSGT